jgi:hypothetical protein
MSRASSSSSRNLTSVSFLVLAIFILVLVLIVKAYMVYIRTPNRVRLVMDDACAAVDPDAPLGDQRTQFLQRWEVAVTANSCPQAIRACDSSGFKEDSFVVVYTDSIELPGLPAFHHLFRIGTSLRPSRETR